MGIKDRKMPPGTPLDMNEQSVKPLLTLWVTEWINDLSRESWVKDSWRNVLHFVPGNTSVDDLSHCLESRTKLLG